MFGFAKKLGKSAKSVVKENVFEATVAAGVLISSVDGSFSKQEQTKLENILNVNDNLNSFSKSAKQKLITKYANLMETDFRLGERKLLKEIEDIAENQDDAEEVFITAISLAEASGDIDKKEQEMLVKIGKVLGLNLKNYGIDDVPTA